MATSNYPTQYDEIVKTMDMYIDGSRQGKSTIMRPAFHPDASFFGYAGEQLAVGTEFLFSWIDKNGPAPDIEPSPVSVDILESSLSSGWTIIQKAFSLARLRTITKG